MPDPDEEGWDDLIPAREEREERAGANAYVVSAHCTNCGAQQMARAPKGTRLDQVECSRCGVRSLRLAPAL
jgi:predicted RNA-binding Zn-ribbon protein involved in translation (DUF1610 family)